MKLIKAIVRPNKVDEVIDAIESTGVTGMIVTEVRGKGHARGRQFLDRGKAFVTSLLPRMEIEVVVKDDWADHVVDLIIRAARTGEIGDGRVFVLPVDHGYNIRTSEKDMV